MCGRFSLSPTVRIIEKRFRIKVTGVDYKPRYNCAPSQSLAVISNNNPDFLSYYRWGLIPFWAKDKSIGNRMINAKAETITEKPSFKNSFKRKRCLVLSDGFFEWKKEQVKIPFRIFIKDELPFAMAGIWDSWKDEQDKEINSFAIITTIANELIKIIHHRMPVILHRENESDWLNSKNNTFLKNLLKPYPSELMNAYPVSTLVNSPTNDVPEILNPVTVR